MKLIAKGLRLLNADKPTQNVASILWGPSGPVNSSTMDDKCAIAQRLADCHNALAGIPDPAAALKAAREALEECANDQCAVTKYDGIGNESHDDAPVTGCDCWACERTRRVRAALNALKGEQP